MSLRCVVGGGDVRVVVQEGIYSGPSSFSHFDDAKATFVDKTLAIEAFLRDHKSHHLILCPRRCGKSFTLSMIRLSSFLVKYFCIANAELFRAFLQQTPSGGPSDITTSQFAGTAITEHKDLVLKHFQQYPVLYIDLKVSWLVSISKGNILNGF